MKKWLLLIFLICGVVFSQEVELISAYDDLLFDQIQFSRIHNDTLLYCSGNSRGDTGNYINAVYNISNLFLPERVWLYDPIINICSTDWCTYNDSLYYALECLTGDGITSFLSTYLWSDSSNHPVVINIDTLIDRSSSLCFSINFNDSFLYITSYTNNTPHFIMNISNPFNPVFQTSFPQLSYENTTRNHLILDDSLLVMLGDNPNYVVYNISNPSEPILITQHNINVLNPEWPWCYITGYHIIDHYMIIHGGRIYTQGFYGILDIENPLEPEPLWYDTSWYQINHVRDNGNILIFENAGMFDPYFQIHIVDFTNPLIPRILCKYPDSLDLELEGHYRFHSQLHDGLLYSKYLFIYDDSTRDYGCLALLNFTEILTRNYTVNLSRGWNLISYPLFEKMAITDYLGNEYISFSFTPSSYLYNETDSLCPGEVVWVLSENDTSIIYSECPNTYMVEKTLYPGWNLVGPTLLDLPTDRILCNPEIIPPIYRFDPVTMEYAEADTLRITQGYWIFANDTTEVTLWREMHDEYHKEG